LWIIVPFVLRIGNEVPSFLGDRQRPLQIPLLKKPADFCRMLSISLVIAGSILSLRIAIDGFPHR
jgi:hypothetical protein